MKNLLIIFAIIIGIYVTLFIAYSILDGLSYKRLLNILAQDSSILPRGLSLGEIYKIWNTHSMGSIDQKS